MHAWRCTPGARHQASCRCLVLRCTLRMQEMTCSRMTHAHAGAGPRQPGPTQVARLRPQVCPSCPPGQQTWPTMKPARPLATRPCLVGLWAVDVRELRGVARAVFRSYAWLSMAVSGPLRLGHPMQGSWLDLFVGDFQLNLQLACRLPTAWRRLVSPPCHVRNAMLRRPCPTSPSALQSLLIIAVAQLL